MVTLILILGHFIADFPFQTANMVKNKSKDIGVVIKHITIHLFTYLVLIGISLYLSLIQYDFLLLITIILICLIHFITDLIKEMLNERVNTDVNNINSYIKNLKMALLYITDQIIHLVTIYIVVKLLLMDGSINLRQIFVAIESKNNLDLSLTAQIICSMIIVLINTYFWGYLIGLILKEFKPSNKVVETVLEGNFKSTNLNLSYQSLNFNDIDDEINAYKMLQNEDVKLNKKIIMIKDSPPKAGMWIGILERNLILIFCLSNNLGGIGFLVAMKALTRFKQFDDKSFAEYYLIGTMLSVIFGVIAGYLMKYIWS
ncbi:MULTISPECIES: DUF3307 domain-containing protein [Solibacillus]|uniref:DUF3307 domain-containing protein n=1 Tax=Solibacillus merdavium TaxID=2762218 RepID=A0ABR8XSX7_9BACL|nr:DUF3307 domain-containing protein [Solibacillus merdavium]MBD8035041.1 DUF3307 domain-containing protein [Solibacillus merdavium]